MSTNSEISEYTEDTVEKSPVTTVPNIPSSGFESVLEQLEVMALQKGSRNSLDLSRLDKGQIDSLLDTVKENEKNAFAYHSKRLDAIKEIEIKRIDASVINQKTKKVVLVGGILIIVPAITLIILLVKDSFFIPWITFMTGSFGGFGLSKLTNGLENPATTKNPIKSEDE